MSQGSFTFNTSGSSTTNFTDDTNFAYLGGTPYTGPPYDWTQVVIGYSGVEPAPSETQTYASNWTISGTGGSGKILQIKLYTGPGGGRFVIVTLAAGGGTLTQGAADYTFNPPQAPPPCFVTGTRILTQNGYKAIETLLTKDLAVLSDGRVVDYALKKIVVESTNSMSAPYRISAGAFGKNKPAADICLSPHHKIQIGNGVWISAERAAKTNSKVRQYGLGESVTYWHIESNDYLKDNLVCEGLVVESLATNKNYNGPVKIYTWNDRLGGFTRPGPYKSKATGKTLAME